MSKENLIIDELMQDYPQLEYLRKDIVLGVETLVSAFTNGNKVLTCGNGGSASDSEHIVGELMKGFILPRKLTHEQVKMIDDTKLFESDDSVGGATDFADKLQQGLPAISLVSQTALMTAFLNDVSADMLFAQQVFVYGQKGDILIALSTSGNSQNVVNAAIAAKSKGMQVISFTGEKESKLSRMSDITFMVPSTKTFKIQEYHLPIYHAVCSMVESLIFDTE